MTETGNLVSASVPVALKKSKDAGTVKTGDRVMLVGFGVGYSWGATVVTIQKGVAMKKTECFEEIADIFEIEEDVNEAT